MRRHLDLSITARVSLAVLLAVVFSATTNAVADSNRTGSDADGKVEWAFKPSYYTHSHTDGQRVARYATGQKAYAEIDNFRRSGYRQQRIRIHGASGSADNIHLVETWGEGEFIRPYGEWQRPFREGATPYGPWGNAQGPWTLPFESWVNPYGLGKLPHPPWPHWPVYSGPMCSGPGYGGPMYPGSVQPGPMPAQYQQP